ncbi:VWA domain-containing protein [Amycolatopsis sp. M39]|nr:VWA domain-containing protein [Amycolatopsis sp. M39]OAP26373.1 VWA domain containing CoxE-like protein [Amycolatopsis sp. M39]
MNSGRELSGREAGKGAANRPRAGDRADPAVPAAPGPERPDRPDLAALASLLLARLREAGVAADPRGAAALTAALPGVFAAPGDRRSRLYWTARVTLVCGPGDLAAYDRVFDDLVGVPSGGSPAPGATLAATRPAAARRAVPNAPAGTETEGAVPWVTRPRQTAAGGPGRPDGRAVPVPAPGWAAARAAPASFDDLDERMLADLGARLRDAAHRRRTRRREASRYGRLDLRRTARRWRRTGGEPLHLVRTRPRHRPRRLVVLCDVSESMRPYVTAFLHLMRAASVEAGETFAFGTTLTRLSPALRRRTPAEAVAEASVLVGDRYGGTRIASSLRTLIRSPHAELLRGAVVVVASDGWDTDPPERLAAEMARIARRAHRVVWINPRAGEPGYRPLVGGMAAALPHCDSVLPAATLAELAGVVDELSSTASRRPRGGTS